VTSSNRISPRIGRGSVRGDAGAVIADVSLSSSLILPMPPAARCSSFQTSASAPTEPPAISAYSTNWPSMPPLMRPATTSWAPDHSTSVIAPKISTIATAVTIAWARMRCRATATATATAEPKRPRS